MLNTRVVTRSIQLTLVMALIAIPALAAPAAQIPAGTNCAVGQSGYALGVDGGLTGLSRGEIAAQFAAEPSGLPLGVDGGVMGLLFARSAPAVTVASTVNACTTAFNPQGG
jgi:hypothetical protein